MTNAKTDKNGYLVFKDIAITDVIGNTLEFSSQMHFLDYMSKAGYSMQSEEENKYGSITYSFKKA